MTTYYRDNQCLECNHTWTEETPSNDRNAAPERCPECHSWRVSSSIPYYYYRSLYGDGIGRTEIE